MDVQETRSAAFLLASHVSHEQQQPHMMPHATKNVIHDLLSRSSIAARSLSIFLPLYPGLWNIHIVALLLMLSRSSGGGGGGNGGTADHVKPVSYSSSSAAGNNNKVIETSCYETEELDRRRRGEFTDVDEFLERYQDEILDDEEELGEEDWEMSALHRDAETGRVQIKMNQGTYLEPGIYGAPNGCKKQRHRQMVSYSDSRLQEGMVDYEEGEEEDEEDVYDSDEVT